MTASLSGSAGPAAWVVAGALAGLGLHLARSAARAGRARRRLGPMGPAPTQVGRRLRVAGAGAGASVARLGRWRQRLAWLRPSSDLDHALVLEAVARSLRGGGSLSQAVDDAVQSLPASAAAAELGEAARGVAAGARLRDALDAWSDRADDARVLAGAALTLGPSWVGRRLVRSMRRPAAFATGPRWRGRCGRSRPKRGPVRW